MKSQIHPETGDEEALGDESGDERVHRVISDEFGERLAELMRRQRRTQEVRYRTTHPEEGLRERKRRLTRQLISDAATSMFAIRGFDNVTVSEVADRVGISEKTVYNYFPTKEALVLDMVDELIDRLARALRERGPHDSLADAVVTVLGADMERFLEGPDELLEFIPLFGQLIDSTPTLRAAWLEAHDRFAKVVRDELATRAEIAPSDPEPMAAGRALAGLSDVAFESQIRHIGEGLRGQALRDAVRTDLERAARLLETGLWSFGLLTRGTRARSQAIEAARVAEEARGQVVKALKQARAAWAEVRARSSP